MKNKVKTPDRVEYGYYPPLQDEGTQFYRRRYYGKRYQTDVLDDDEIVDLLNQADNLKRGLDAGN